MVQCWASYSVFSLFQTKPYSWIGSWQHHHLLSRVSPICVIYCTWVKWFKFAWTATRFQHSSASASIVLSLLSLPFVGVVLAYTNQTWSEAADVGGICSITEEIVKEVVKIIISHEFLKDPAISRWTRSIYIFFFKSQVAQTKFRLNAKLQNLPPLLPTLIMIFYGFICNWCNWYRTTSGVVFRCLSDITWLLAWDCQSWQCCTYNLSNVLLSAFLSHYEQDSLQNGCVIELT